MLSRGTVKRASMVPPRDIQVMAGCERNVEDDFLAEEIVGPLDSIPLFPPPIETKTRREYVFILFCTIRKKGLRELPYRFAIWYT
jgi:hypothetical protein